MPSKRHQGAFFFTRLIRAPEGVSLYYHSFAYPQIFAVWSLEQDFRHRRCRPSSLLQNLTILASFPLAGAGAFYLCRYLERQDFWARRSGGFIFAFSPWHIAQAMHHAHVAGIEFLPFFVLCYLLALERESYRLAGSSNPSAVRSARLSCWYYLFYCFYFLVLPSSLSARASNTAGRAAGDLAAPALVPRRARPAPVAADRADGAERVAWRRSTEAGSNIFVADLLALHRLSAHPSPAAHGARGFYRTFTGNSWEDTRLSRSRQSRPAGLGFLASAKWRTPPALVRAGRDDFLRRAGQRRCAALARSSRCPSICRASCFPNLPFFANVRTPARAIVFVYLFLGIGVAMPPSWPRHKAQRRLMTGAVLGARRWP